MVTPTGRWRRSGPSISLRLLEATRHRPNEPGFGGPDGFGIIDPVPVGLDAEGYLVAP